MAPLSAATPQGRQLMRHALTATSVFAAWPAEHLDKVIDAARLTQYDEAEEIPLGVRRLREVIVVVNGYVEVSSLSPEGRRYVLTLLGPGQISGLLRMVDAPVPPNHYRTMEASLLIHIPCTELRRLLDEMPVLWRDVALHGLARQRASVLAKHHFAVSDPTRLVASALLELLERDIHAKRADDAPAVRVSQVELAARLGRSRMTTRKGLDSLKKRGWIGLGYGRIEVLKLQELQALVA